MLKSSICTCAALPSEDPNSCIHLKVYVQPYWPFGPSKVELFGSLPSPMACISCSTPRPRPARGLAGGHPTQPILSPTVPHSSATSAFGCLDRKTLNQLPAITSQNYSQPASMCGSKNCVCVYMGKKGKKKKNKHGEKEELPVKIDWLKVTQWEPKIGVWKEATYLDP